MKLQVTRKGPNAFKVLYTPGLSGLDVNMSLNHCLAITLSIWHSGRVVKVLASISVWTEETPDPIPLRTIIRL